MMKPNRNGEAKVVTRNTIASIANATYPITRWINSTI